MSSLCQNPDILYASFIQFNISNNSSYYFLEMIMIISLIDTLTQIRVVAAYITFPDMAPRRCQCAFLMFVTIQICYVFSTVDYYFGVIDFLFS